MKRLSKTLIVPIQNVHHKEKWHNSITLKIALVAWSLIISSIVIIGSFNFINQQKIILERMKIEASNVSESIIQAHATSLFTDNYEAVIDFCTKLVSSSSSIELIALTKRDGKSLIFKRGNWSFETLKGSWIQPDKFFDGKISYSEILARESFQFSKPFIFTGVNWGYVHLNISLDSYNEAMKDLIWRTGVFSLSFMILGFFVSAMFSKRLTRPIKELVNTTREVEAGNLKIHARILSHDELGFLAHSFNTMISAVNKSNEFLEATVLNRTLELGQTNQKLVEEVNERKKAEVVLHQYAVKLKTLEEIYKGIINAESTDDVFYNTIEIIHKKLITFTMTSLNLYDVERSLVRVNSFSYRDGQFVQTVNEYPSENYSRLIEYADDEYYLSSDISSIVDKSIFDNFISTEGRKSYISFPLRYQNELIGELIFGFDETIVIEDEKLNILVEISHHVSVAVMQLYLEEKLKLHAGEMKQSLQEKEILLKEIHHRVKNNLQLISSLLFLQSRNIGDEASLSIFRDSQLRVCSLALVHEKLYQSNDLSQIDFAEYIKNLVTHIRDSYSVSSREIAIIFELDKIFIPVDKAVPIGLLLNELVSNSFKYAFPESESTHVKKKFILVKLTTHEPNKHLLLVSDNGIGLPETLNIEATNSLGLKIVSSLVSQINGKLTIKRKDNTEFVIVFNKEQGENL